LCQQGFKQLNQFRLQSRTRRKSTARATRTRITSQNYNPVGQNRSIICPITKYFNLVANLQIGKTGWRPTPTWTTGTGLTRITRTALTGLAWTKSTWTTWTWGLRRTKLAKRRGIANRTTRLTTRLTKSTGATGATWTTGATRTSWTARTSTATNFKCCRE
jgi:hypothetical protein